MAMWALGPMEILLLMAFGGGGHTADLASFLPADVYFRSRNVPINVQNMIDFAAKKPDDGKTQLGQLLALRMLAERPELVKNAKDKAQVLKTLDQIARGELAKDRLGFSQEYAARTLAALGGPNVPIEEAKPVNMRQATLGWFPQTATLVGAFHAGDRISGPADGRELRTFWGKVLKDKDWEKVFEVAELIGNVRIERAAFAFVADKDNDQKNRFMLRVGGKADHQRLVEAVKKLAPAMATEIKQGKDAKGVPIMRIEHDAEKPAVALIGDTDLVLVATGPKRGDSGDVLKQLLAVRDGKQGNVVQDPGMINALLGKVSPKAVGLIVGELPDELRKNMFGAGTPVPRSLRVEVLQTKEGADIRGHLVMANAQDANALTQLVLMGQKQMLDGLTKVPPDVPIAPSTIAALKKAAESVQVRSQGDTVEGGVFIPTEALRSLPLLFLTGRVAGDVQPAQPPPAKNAPGPAALFAPLTMPLPLVACLHGKT